MNYPSRKFDELVSAVCHGMAKDEQVQELAGLLRADAAARDAYLLAVELHARLASDNRLFVQQLRMPPIPEEETPCDAAVCAQLKIPVTRLSRCQRRLYLAASATAIMLLTGFVIWHFGGRGIGVVNTTPVAVSVLEADNAAPGAWQPGQSLSLSQLNLATGTLRVQIKDSGVVLGVSGPAEVHFVNPMLARLDRGQITADVGEHGNGFSVETAQGRFVDLGTTFGIDAGTQGTTDLVVFKGSVQVYSSAKRTAALSTLTEGEAVRVGNDKSLARIPNIVSGPAPGPWSTQPPKPDRCVIASVRDNLRSPHDRVFYQIVPDGFRENTQAYVGPRHVWKGRTAKGLPPYLLGADVVRTFPTDQGRKGLGITVRLSRPAMLYVLFETRPQQEAWRQTPNIPEAPAWLEKNFHKIGDAVGLDDAGQLKPGEVMSLKPGEGHLVTFDVWERKIPEPGDVTLGPPTGPEGWKNWMYGVLARPLEQAHVAVPENPGFSPEQAAAMALRDNPTACPEAESHARMDRSCQGWTEDVSVVRRCCPCDGGNPAGNRLAADAAAH
jgi:hypothetical protein